MYNQYNPYINRFYGQQQANMPQPMELPQQTQNVSQMGLNRAFEDIDKRLEKLDFSEIDDLKDDLEDLKKELKDIKNKLKAKKED